MSTKPSAACSIEIPKIPETNSEPFVRPRLDALTSLRSFAALHVVLFHMRVTGIVAGGPWWYQNFASIGYVGVNFFFVLSGFILVYTYAAPSLEPRRFWQARFARIYPAYIVSLIVSASYFFFAARHLNLPFFSWSKDHLVLASILTVCLLQSWLPQAALAWNSVCWSLSVEAFFYSVFPFVLRHAKSMSQRRLLGGIAGFSFLSLLFSLSYLLLHPDGADKISSGATDLFWKNVLSFHPLVRVPEFLVGMCAGLLFLGAKNARRWATPLVVAGLVVLSTLTLLADRIPSPLISAGFLSPAFAALIYGIALQPRWASFLAAPFLVLLGDASYSLYLLHSIVISRAFDAMSYLPPEIRVAASLATAIGAALLCYDLIEQPARKLLRPNSTLVRLSRQLESPI
jgi:peptidoglycan/LPS O-acetylase OafA/YrhL